MPVLLFNFSYNTLAQRYQFYFKRANKNMFFYLTFVKIK